MARRSARLSKTNAAQSPQPTKPSHTSRLGSLFEQEEYVDAVEQHQSIDNVINTPASLAAMDQQLKALSSLKTPKTEPKPPRGEMHPKAVHSTTKAPDSGFKLGFVDLPANPPTVASAQNTPSRSHQTASKPLPVSAFKFDFGSDTALSSEAQRLMENVREEAAKIKAQMQMEKDQQDEKDANAEQMFDGLHATGRKIAKPTSKAGRFSDVHMAQFKKMDSIANHPSSFRAKPGYTQPTSQSLKRSGSRAGLDEPERPHTAGRGTPSRNPPPLGGRPALPSPYKSNQQNPSERPDIPSPAKRLRRIETEDVSTSRLQDEQAPKASAIPKSISSSLLSPTKASLARTGQASSTMPSLIPRTTSARSMRKSAQKARSSSAGVSKFTSKLIEAQQEARHRPLPPTPLEPSSPMALQPFTNKRQESVPSATPKPSSFSSKLPTFAGLKSILRSTRKVSSNKSSERPGTPKRPNTANTAVAESLKKVDFTPSVKSRYAVKLAASSPAPARLPSSEERPSRPLPVVPYDAAAYVVEDDGDVVWEDVSSPLTYPTLPPPPAESPVAVGRSVSQKAKDHNRRESKEFKSIFTTLHPPSRPSSSTHASVGTALNETSPPAARPNKVTKSPSNNSTKPSPSTIRRVRQSGVSEVIQPFEDASVKTMPHGLPAKKRRHQSIVAHASTGTDKDAKEKRSSSRMPAVPGGWEDSILDQENQSPSDAEDEIEDEGAKRGGKRARLTASDVPAMSGYDADTEKDGNATKGKAPRRFTDVDEKVDVVKGLTAPSAAEKRKSVARQQAAKNAKDRKTGVLSLSRLNMLSRPKQR